MKKMSKDRVLFNIIGYLFITLLAVACVLPFIMVISGSLTAEESIIQKGYSVFPREFSLNAYRLALKAPEKILRAYGVTTFVTVVGTFLGLLITSMTAYVLQRKDFSWRNKFAYFFFFTTLFSGGLVPWYVLMVKYLHLKNSIAAVILPGMLSVFNILIMRNFMSGVDESLIDSNKNLSDKLTQFETEKAQATRSQQILAKAKEYGIPENYAKRCAIKDDEDLDVYFKDLKQEFANDGFIIEKL